MIRKKKLRTLVEGVQNSANDLADLLHLTANENQLSRNANMLLSSKLSERYFFGGGDKDGVIDFESYTFRGLPAVNDLAEEARSELMKMSGASEVNLNCFSGLHAMMCAILVSTSPGDTVMSIPFEDGGHAATKGIIENIGRKHIFAKFNQDELDFDFEETIRRFRQSKAKAFYVDISAHIQSLDIKKLRKLLSKDSTIIYDASHSLGLILGGSFPSPFKQGADIICANTHKTFAGPQSGIILYKSKELGEKANWIINTTFVSSVHTARLIALSVSILEYSRFGKSYAKQVVKNSNTLAKELEKRGYEVRKLKDGTYSNNEQAHLFIDTVEERTDLYRKLIKNNISTNFMQILGGRPFARLGTQEITRRGMKTREMKIIALLLDRALKGERVKEEVVKFTRGFPDIKYSFDELNNLKKHE